MSLLDIKTIYLQKSAKNYSNYLDIVDKFPSAKIYEVNSHWQIPQLNQDSNNLEQWTKNKRNTLVIGVKSNLSCRENGRSTDWIAPSHTNGCTLSCNYCYVARRKGYANPITTFVNIEEIKTFIQNYSSKLPDKKPNQCDPTYWIYEIGENSDCSVDDLISNNIKQLITLFTKLPNAKASFATKYVNRKLLEYDPQQKTRIRFSLMPENIRKSVDIRTSSIQDRLSVVNEFVDAGYEVHLNFSPIIIYNGWVNDWIKLFNQINDSLNDKAKSQLKCEVIFLTHNKDLHEVNKIWHPKGEELLWTPQWQENKISLNGAENIRYKYQLKNIMIDKFKEIHSKYLDYCKIRYIF